MAVTLVRSYSVPISPKDTPSPIESKNFNYRPLDEVFNTFALPFMAANRYAEEGHFWSTRLAYIAQICVSPFGILAILCLGLYWSGKHLAHGNAIQLISTLASIVTNILGQVHLMITSALSLAAPLPLNRLIRGVDKKALPQSKGPDTIDTTIFLLLEACKFFSWARKKEIG